MNDGDGLTIDVWWISDCGYLHLERNPVVIDAACPHRDEIEAEP